MTITLHEQREAPEAVLLKENGPVAVSGQPSTPVKVSREVVHPLVSRATSERLAKIQAKRDLATALPLVVGDCFAVFASVAVAGLIGTLVGVANVFAPEQAILLAAWTLLVQHVHGLYPACGLARTLEYRRILRTCLIVSTGLLVGLGLRGSMAEFPWIPFLAFSVAMVAVLPTIRSIIRSTFSKFDWWAQPVAIIGESAAAIEAFERLARTRKEGLRPFGIIFDNEKHFEKSLTSAPYLIGPVGEIDDILAKSGTCRVVVPFQTEAEPADYRPFLGIPHVTVGTPLKFHPTEKTRLIESSGYIAAHCSTGLCSLYARAAKRATELGLIVASLPILLPVVIILGTLVRLSSPGPVFYSQVRIGRHGRKFRAWKFRSMVRNADQVLANYLAEHPELRAEWEKDHKLKNDPRITGIGRLLRKTSLDELPQLWNVICGEMSLVGPRPIVDAEIAKYGDHFDLYTLVPPGITGLWQVSGRNNTTYAQRLEYDRYYVQNWSYMLDIDILYRTIRTALLQEGAY